MGPLILSTPAVLETTKTQGRTPVQSALAPLDSIPIDFGRGWIRSPRRAALWKAGNCVLGKEKPSRGQEHHARRDAQGGHAPSHPSGLVAEVGELPYEVGAAQRSWQVVRCLREKMPSARSRFPWQAEGRVAAAVLAVGRGEAGGGSGEGASSLPRPHPHHSQHQRHPLPSTQRSKRTMCCSPARRKAPGGEALTSSSLTSVRARAGLFPFISHSAANYNAKGWWLLQVIRGNTLRNGERRGFGRTPLARLRGRVGKGSAGQTMTGGAEAGQCWPLKTSRNRKFP